jgi:hypothetical protein
MGCWLNNIIVIAMNIMDFICYWVNQIALL